MQRKKSRHKKMLDSSCRVTMNLAWASGGMGSRYKHKPYDPTIAIVCLGLFCGV